MFRLVSFLNAVLVFPFAVSAIAAPNFTFGLFGLDLGAEGAGVARGYGAAALGWALACALLGTTRHREVMRAILVASLAFNTAEVLVQVPIALSGIASPMIWATILGHGVVAVLSALGLARLKTGIRLTA